MQDRIKQLVEILSENNKLYRTGLDSISDTEYDELFYELSILDPKNEFFNKIGINVDSNRKSKLPIEMASMSKVKELDEIKNWIRLKKIDENEELVITPKFDGLSLCVNEENNFAWTRGDGEYGQSSNEHYKLIQNKLKNKSNVYTYGEVIMPKKVFFEKYSSEFSNPRNLVAGLLNNKLPTEPLKDCVYIKYGLHNSNYKNKSDIIDFLNINQDVCVNYVKIKLSKITEEILEFLFKEWSQDYEIDGLIIELNSLKLQEELGRETSSNNPVWARAFKSPKFEEVKEAEVTKVVWNISKQGLLKPVIQIKPVNVSGVVISNITGNNALFIKNMGIGIGSIITIKRSGMVIPMVVNVIKKAKWEEPYFVNTDIEWSESGIELKTVHITEEQKLKQIISFFQILDTKNVSEGVITQLWDFGYQSIEHILSLEKEDYEEIPGFGKKKAKIVFDSIQKSIKNVELCKLQHASNIFQGLGSKKLALLEHFKTKPSIFDVMEIEGFAEISARIYVNNYDRFFEFIKDLPITIKEKVKSGSDKLSGQTFVFTGVRLPDYEKIIEENGGKVSSSVSKNTTYLVMKQKGSGSSKETKALDLGVSVITVEELEKILL